MNKYQVVLVDAGIYSHRSSWREARALENEILKRFLFWCGLPLSQSRFLAVTVFKIASGESVSFRLDCSMSRGVAAAQIFQSVSSLSSLVI